MTNPLTPTPAAPPLTPPVATPAQSAQAGLAKPLRHLSPSSIKLWVDCPRSWWAKYVEGRKTPVGAAADLGSSFGVEVVKAIGCPVNLEAPNAREKFGPSALPTIPDDQVNGLIRAYRKKAWAWTYADMAEAEARMSEEQIDRLAQGYGLPRPKALFVPFLGYIDLIRSRIPGGPPEIVDLKTSKAKGFKTGWAFQLLTYCCAKEAVAAEIHLTTTTQKPAAYRYNLRVEKEMLRWAVSRLCRVYREIEFALNAGAVPDEEPGFHCAYCAATECHVKYALDVAGAEIE